MTNEVFLHMSKIAFLIRGSAQCIKYYCMSLLGLYSECLGNRVKLKIFSVGWSLPSYIPSSITFVKWMSWKSYQRKIPDFVLLRIAVYECVRLDLRSGFVTQISSRNMLVLVWAHLHQQNNPLWVGIHVSKVHRICP